MQEKQLFEYATIRIMPRVEREEFLNVGIIVFCKRPPFLQAVYTIDEIKLTTMFPGIDTLMIKDHLQSLEKICTGTCKVSAIAKLDSASRFRWLTAKRSTMLQTSAVHPGFTADASATLQRLFEQQVLG